MPGPFPGRYYDGVTAREHAVDVTIGPEVVEITGQAGSVREFWPFDSLWTPKQRLRAGKPTVLGSHEKEEARLHVDTGLFAAALLAVEPRLGNRFRAGPERAKQVALVFALILLVGGGLFAVLHFWAVPIAKAIPPKWVEPLGDQAYGLLVGKAKICKDERAEKAIADLTAKLLEGLEDPPQITVLVADHPMVNAFALPGGRVVFMRGILKRMRSSKEFAGVLAHEIIHVHERHPTVSLVRGLGIDAIISVLLGGSDIAESAGTVGGFLTMMSYSRGLETEADTNALKQLEQNRIDPRAWQPCSAASIRWPKVRRADRRISSTIFPAIRPARSVSTVPRLASKPPASTARP